MNKKFTKLTLLAAVVLSLAVPVACSVEGDILWQKDDLGENLESAPAVDASGNVYVIGTGTVYSYTSGGTFRWSTATSEGDGCTPSVSPDNTVVYTCGWDGVYALNASNGDEIWNQPTGVYATVPCVSPDGTRIYIGEGHESSPSDNFHALDASDGSIEWTYVETENPTQGIRGFMGGAVVDTDGTIYVANQHGFLISLTDNGTGYTQNWKFSFGAEARQPVTISDDGYVYATCNTGKVHKINKATGVEDTSGSWPALGSVGEVFASMCFSPDGSTLYVNAEDSKLHAVNSDGSEKWSYQFDAWGSDPLVRNDGKIIVMGQVSGAGRVCCLSDNGTSASLDWYSDQILANLTLNETNVNIAPNGTIYVHSGDQSPLALFAVEGNGQGLSTSSPNPKYMCNIQNNGIFGGGGDPCDFDPPTPNPMTWASVPTADDTDSISMTATTATDPSGVEYYFMETSANPGGSDSDWQGGTSYTDSGLSAETQYCYEVQARDKSPNQNPTAWSTNECATTPAGPVFADNFESATDWSNNWTAYGAWQRVTARPYDGSYSAEIDGVVTDSALVSAAINVTGNDDATVTFAWYIEGSLDAGEYLRFDVDTGSGWVQMASLDGDVDPEDTWHNESIPVDVSATSTMYIRFRGTINKSNEDAYVDVVEVNTGSVPPDTTPPTPDPMTWASLPSAGGSSNSISMTATTATDPSGVEYYFHETSGNPGGSDSEWQPNTDYTDTGLSASTQYCYQVRARDKSPNQNATDWSTTECATTGSGGGGDCHVDAVVCITVKGPQGTKRPAAEVTIKDDQEVLVPNALVIGRFLIGPGYLDEWHGPFSATTNGDGVATVVCEDWYDKPGFEFEFYVDDVQHPTLPYDPDDNVTDMCGWYI